MSAVPVRVAVFDGRETDSKHFLWTHLLTQLDRVQKWTGGPDPIPGPATWAEMIGPEPCLIVLDELPPYLEGLAMRKAGMDQTEADRLALGLANLMAAIATNRLPHCCLVLSDLVSSWQKGSAKIQVAIEEAMKSIDN